MSMTRRRPIHSGFTLLHVIIAMSLLGVFLGIASQLTIRCTQQWTELAARESSVVRMEHALRRLQHDTWGAQTLASPDPSELVLVQPDGQRIVWIADPDERTLHREPSGEDGVVQRWPFEGNAPFAFEVHDGQAWVALKSGDHAAVMVNQMNLAQRNEP